MPRRDGQPTPQELAAQRPTGPTQPAGGQLPPREAAIAALQATTAAASTAAQAPPYIAPALTVAVITAAAAGILGSFERFLSNRRLEQESYVSDLLEAEVPDLDETERIAIVTGELDAEKQFAIKARQRLDRDLPKALSIADPTIREAQVQKILNRERHYAEMREMAMATRTLGTAEQQRAEKLSPAGGFWHLSQHVKEHTLDCLAMGNKVWPHSVLRTYHPPLHGGCPCEIWTIQEAEQAGLLHHPAQYATADQSLQAMQVVEAEFDVEDFADELAVLEAFYDERWSVGTTKAGQFRPRRGGDPGSLLRHRRSARMHLPAATPVTRLDRHLDVRELQVKHLREGDHVMVNGALERVTKVHDSPPGLMELEHTGLVHISRDTIQGIPGEAHAASGGHASEIAHLESAMNTVRDIAQRVGPTGDRFAEDTKIQQPGTDTGKISALWAVQRHATSLASAHHDLGYAPTDQRRKNSASKALADARTSIEQNIEQVQGSRVLSDEQRVRALEHLSAAHRAVTGESARGDVPKPPKPPAPEPAPPHLGGGATHEDVAKIARMRKPAAGGQVIQGVHFNPDLGRSEARGEDLHLPPGFFKQSRAIREKVLFRHYGAKLAEGLGPDGIKTLGAQDAHLSSKKSIVDVYHALNIDGGRERMIQLHPDAARLVATAAHERGLPLHPDAARLARAQASNDTPPAEHPAHALAASLHGLRSMESRDRLTEAGYGYGGGQPGPDGKGRLVFHNHDAGASIVTIHGDSGKVEATQVDVPAAVPETEASKVLGSRTSEAVVAMRGQGFAAGYVTAHQNGHDWLRFVHPDGRGRALQVTDDLKIGKVTAFTPPDTEVAAAQRQVLQGDPLAHIKPGEGFQELHDKLTSGHNGWAPAHAGEIHGHQFTTYRRGSQHLTVHHDTAKVIGAGIAHPDIQGHPGQIISASELQAAEAEKKARDEQKRAEQEASRAAATTGLLDAIARGDNGAVKTALSGLSVNDAVRHLQNQGLQLRGRRRAGRGSARTITYTLRGPNGETVKIGGLYTFGGGAVQKVEVAGNPQGGKRNRLPAGQAPRNLNELLVDALGRADEIGQRFDAGVNVTAITQGGVQRGAAAHHEWNGTIAIRKNAEGADIKDYLSKRQKAEPLTDRQHLTFYNHLETLQHEINHGVGKRGDGPGGLAFTPQHYSGLGRNVEEALTEETGHVLAVDWLRSHGMTDVLEAVKRNPQDPRVVGVYQQERTQLKRVLDDANVPHSERAALLQRMKFQMTPAEQYAEIMRLAGTTNLREALFADPKRRSEMGRTFEPVVRPDLSDINATAETTVTDGRKVTGGSEVEVDVGGQGRGTNGQIAGKVVAVMDDVVRVRTDDGLELWYSAERVH